MSAFELPQQMAGLLGADLTERVASMTAAHDLVGIRQLREDISRARASLLMADLWLARVAAGLREGAA